MAKIKPLVRPPEPPTKVFPTGSTLLDLQNGGGWAIGRMVNVVGDASSGKTLLAIEACANFARLYGTKHVRYCESEAAFDADYARSLGLPDGISLTQDIRTVEELNDDLKAFLNTVPDGGPCLYCLDSADALSDKAEANRDIGDASYGASKAKAFSEMFRRLISLVEQKGCCLFIVSQVRDRIGVIFGPSKTRSGGKALDFYASQIVWLSETKKEQRSVLGGLERIVGINVRAANKKNKLSQPFREVDFLLVFNYGVDDELSMVNWLKKNKAEEAGLSLPLDRYAMAIRRARDAHDSDKLSGFGCELRGATRARWLEIEEALRPPMRKYTAVNTELLT